MGLRVGLQNVVVENCAHLKMPPSIQNVNIVAIATFFCYIHCTFLYEIFIKCSRPLSRHCLC